MSSSVSLHYGIINNVNVTILLGITHSSAQNEVSVDMSVVTCHTLQPQCYDVIPVLRDLVFEADARTARSNCVDFSNLQLPCFSKYYMHMQSHRTCQQPHNYPHLRYLQPKSNSKE